MCEDTGRYMYNSIVNLLTNDIQFCMKIHETWCSCKGLIRVTVVETFKFAKYLCNVQILLIINYFQAELFDDILSYCNKTCSFFNSYYLQVVINTVFPSF